MGAQRGGGGTGVAHVQINMCGIPCGNPEEEHVQEVGLNGAVGQRVGNGKGSGGGLCGKGGRKLGGSRSGRGTWGRSLETWGSY